jgi:hypothetical protein
MSPTSSGRLPISDFPGPSHNGEVGLIEWSSLLAGEDKARRAVPPRGRLSWPRSGETTWSCSLSLCSGGYNAQKTEILQSEHLVGSFYLVFIDL